MQIKPLRNKTIKIALIAGNRNEPDYEDTKAYAEVILDDDISLFITKSLVQSNDKDVLRYILTCAVTGSSVNKWNLHGKTQKELLSKISQFPDLLERVAIGRKKLLT